jgi:protein subunit release factor A
MYSSVHRNGEWSQLKNKELAMKMLMGRLYDIENEKREAGEQARRGDQMIGTGVGGRRYGRTIGRIVVCRAFWRGDETCH